MKNVVLGFFLGLFLGPLGMLYSTVFGAIVMLIISGGVTAATGGIGLPAMFPICAIWALLSCRSHNRRYRDDLQRHAAEAVRQATNVVNRPPSVRFIPPAIVPGDPATSESNRYDPKNPDMNSFL